MIFDKFTYKCSLIRNIYHHLSSSPIKFADRFFRKRSTPFRAGPPQTVCASFVCTLTLLYTVFVFTYSRRNFASSVITNWNAMCRMCNCTHGHWTSGMRVNDLTAICWTRERLNDWRKTGTNKAEISIRTFPSESPSE